MPLLTPEFVRIAGLVTGIIVTVIAVYKFVIQRPRLQLTAEHNRDFFYGDLVRTNLQFFISNHGLRYAEDVYIEIYLPDWNFGEPRRKIEIGTTVSTIEDGERTVHETYGSHHDPDSEILTMVRTIIHYLTLMAILKTGTPRLKSPTLF